MIDFARITVRAGNGGDGAGSFRHIKGKRYGKADGGNGGRGGNVFAQATADLNSLEPYRYVKDYAAQNGGRGASNLRRGADGRDLILKVPAGTQVKVKSIRGKVDSQSQKFDLTGEDQEVLIARGGEGGRGNAHLRDDYGRRPGAGEKGQEGEHIELELELKTIADVGIIGLPNAGKSTLLSYLTAAKPSIAEYPFTTLEPNLGVMVVGKRRIVIADIPGLIEGASQGKGLGDKFLRHIERTKVLIHLIDISGTADVGYVYQTVRGELKAYGGLLRKREIIVLNKIDLATEEQIKRAEETFKLHRKKSIAISAETGQGLEELKQEIFKKI